MSLAEAADTGGVESKTSTAHGWELSMLTFQGLAILDG